MESACMLREGLMSFMYNISQTKQSNLLLHFLRTLKRWSVFVVVAMLSQTLSVKENKPPIVNTQCVVYLFQCDLCDANYVGYTARHLHQRISEHRYSAIGKHLETQHGNNRTKTDHLFKVLRKCNSKFDCLVYEMLYIEDIKPSLNTQADSIRPKLIM